MDAEKTSNSGILESIFIPQLAFKAEAQDECFMSLGLKSYSAFFTSVLTLHLHSVFTGTSIQSESDICDTVTFDC